MSRLLAACLTGLTLVAVLPAVTSAQPDLPHLKPGLWDTAASLSGIKVNVQMCLDESVESQAVAFRPPSANGGPPDCSQREVKPVPGGVDMEMTCTIRGRVTHTSMMVTGDFQSGYAMNMTLQPQGGPETTITSTAHWAGQCPAGMKPGQAVTKMDMSSLAAAAAAFGAARKGGAAPAGDGN